jgi:hypothetical protein
MLSRPDSPPPSSCSTQSPPLATGSGAETPHAGLACPVLVRCPRIPHTLGESVGWEGWARGHGGGKTWRGLGRSIRLGEPKQCMGCVGGHQVWGEAGGGSGLSCLVSVNVHNCSHGTAREDALSSAAAGLRRIIADSLTPLSENVQEACRLFTYGAWSRCHGRLGCCYACVQSGGEVE